MAAKNNMIKNIDFDEKEFMNQSYDLYGVKYTLYEGNNRFYGTPVPEGYQATYVPKEDFVPDMLTLKRKE